MIISPPFLPDGDVDQSTADETWVGAMMSHTGDGKFPVSDYFQWHGGVHLVAPDVDSKTKGLVANLDYEGYSVIEVE